jgi:GT2 family glycosyltransferase
MLPPTTAPYPTERGCAGAMLIPRAALERVGGFDESLFAYAEDVDWSLRARAAGLEIRVVPASVVYHRVSAASGGASSPATLYYALRNGLVVAERYAPLGGARTLGRRAEALAAFVVQALRSSSRLAGLQAVLQGLGDASRQRLGPRDA